MKDFTEFYLMNTDDIKRYAVDVLHRFADGEETDCIEIGDGNINYVLASSHQSASNPNNVTQKDKVAFYRASKNSGASVPANGAYLAVPKAVSNSVKAFYLIYDYPEEPL